MRIIKRVVPNNFNIYDFGDLHIGAVHCHDSGIDQMIDMMHSEYDGVKHNIGLNKGDAIEAITVDDPRFSIEATDTKIATPQAQADYAAEKMRPIKDLLVTQLDGNHEDKLYRSINYTTYMLEKINKKHIYGTKCCVIEYIDKKGRLLFKHFAHHGFGSLNSTVSDVHARLASKQRRLKAKLQFMMADCALMTMGHSHQLLKCDPLGSLAVTDGGRESNYTDSDPASNYIHPDHRFYVSTGSFLKLYVEGFSGYAEKAGLDPVELGFPIIKVRNRKIQGVDLITL